MASEYTTLLLVFASFSGGLVAVIIGQFLQFYREQRDQIEELFIMIEIVENLESQKTPYSYSHDDLDEILADLKELYMRTKWVLNDSNERYVGELIKGLQSFQDRRQMMSSDSPIDFESPESNRRSQIVTEKGIVKGYAEKASENVKKDFERIPMRKFIPRYFGYFAW